MSTILIIIIVLIFEYFYDDIKKFRQNEMILKSFHSFRKSLGKSDYVINKILNNIIIILGGIVHFIT